MHELAFEEHVLYKMATRGSSLLRAIQNDEMFPLDLLVRESIQNSLDAALDGNVPASRAQPVQVEYEISAVPETIIQLFPQVLFPSTNQQEMLIIRDKGTCGLTGPEAHSESISGNFTKLVYDINNPQDKKESGGSWGLGKTVYYRMGIGLVIFYSRIKLDDEDNYQERFAACFVENEESSDRLIHELNSGIAWWGERCDGSSKETKAVTSSQAIKEYLELLGVNQFEGENTGTTVIIPFIKSSLLPSNFNGEEETESRTCEPWWNGIEGYLEAAVQRWYCIRLGNEIYPHGPSLHVTINGKEVRNSYPVFKIFQELYTIIQEAVSPSREKEILLKDINIRNTLVDGSTAAKMVAQKCTLEDLRMTPPDNSRHPYEHAMLQIPSTEQLAPLCAYVRKPGMILNWMDQDLAGKMPKTTAGSLLVVLIVPESDKVFNSEIRGATECDSLESYLRSTEKADHTRWVDRADIKIVSKIKAGVLKVIREEYSDGITPVDLHDSHIGIRRRLAESFMPKNWGKDPSSTIDGGGDEEGHIARGMVPSLRIRGIEYPYSGSILVDWDLYWGKINHANIDIQAGIYTESGSINRKKWYENSTFDSFPIEVTDFSINEIDNRKRGKNPSSGISLSSGIVKCNVLEISIIQEGVRILRINDSMEGWKISGTITLAVKDQTIRPALSLAHGGDKDSQNTEVS